VGSGVRRDRVLSSGRRAGASRPSVEGLGAVFISQIMLQEERRPPAPVPRGGLRLAGPGDIQQRFDGLGYFSVPWLFDVLVLFFGLSWFGFLLLLLANRRAAKHLSRGSGGV